MPAKIDLVILADNRAAEPGWAVEHGLAMVLDRHETHLLFDTGVGGALPENADRSGTKLDQTNLIVLSHGHYDHTGGLPYALAAAESAKIWLHPNALKPRFGCLQNPPHKPIGMHPETARLLQTQSTRITCTTQPTQIDEGLWVTGPIPGKTTFEDTGDAAIAYLAEQFPLANRAVGAGSRFSWTTAH